jgi:hypothetical protein
LTLPSHIRSLRDEIDPLALSIGVLLVLTLVVQMARPAPTPIDHAAALMAVPPITRAMAAPVPDATPILAHPLFTPGRGLAGAAGASQAASTTLSDYSVVGVVRVGARGEAILRGPAGETISLRAGETLLGWRLAAVHQAGIVLQQGDIKREVAVASPAAPKTGAP